MLLVRQRERFWRFTRLMHMLVGAALIVASAFMQAADAQQFRQPRHNDKERLRMIRECMEMEMNRKHNYPFRSGSREHMYHACMANRGHHG